ncbi:zinc finger BED domain-containing protein 5-like [Homarus americanus]|uniref:zinc finger BED domain-containing protein 5-like n=1 Tax=Homarus americanus TaxID=6706 RepID=UPI001C48A743|nr:zinc finger BED domain-containing protein 5-like [Homarus americanus]
MSADIKEQVVAAIKKRRKFSLQLDESTDVSDDAQLLVYARYQGTSDKEENFQFCKQLETTTTGEDLFKLVDSFIKEENLSWDQCFSVCSDGAPAMQGARQGFTARVKQVNPAVIVVHCLLHWENLASRKLSHELNSVMEDVIKIVNFIKSSALNSRLFNQMCSDMGSEYEHLLYYSAVRWLSRGKVLQRVFEMRTQVEIILNEKKHALASRLSEPRWLLQLTYLADIFSELNLLNMSMQGRDDTYLTLSEKLKAFKAKLRLWKGKIERGKAASFPLLNLFLKDEEDVSLLDVQNIIVEHLEK